MASSSDDDKRSPDLPDEMADYLQTFLDETEEQLDDLVETLLALEADATNNDDLNEAFRLIHSIKGSAGMMGLGSISVLTHDLESRFERFRSGAEQLDERTMGVVLRCIDFLKQCNRRLRSHEELGSPAQLLEELKELSEFDQTVAESLEPENGEQVDSKAGVSLSDTNKTEHLSDPTNAPSGSTTRENDPTVRIMTVQFETGLQLPDLKAQLILTRLSNLAEILQIEPTMDEMDDVEELERLVIHLRSEADQNELHTVANLDGVEGITIAPSGRVIASAATPAATVKLEFTDSANEQVAIDLPGPSVVEAVSKAPIADVNLETTVSSGPNTGPEPAVEDAEDGNESAARGGPADDGSADPSESPSLEVNKTHGKPADSSATNTRIAETMRVDIDRLDKLMNLTGELVVNRARFQQVLSAMDPAWRKTGMLTRIREFKNRLQDTLENLKNSPRANGGPSVDIQSLASGMELLQEQCEILENGRHCFDSLGEAVDQLSIVSHNLQHGVLETRMVPIAPLFNRFRRVVRDLSKDRGKQVQLEIRGEKTELDKRMIDELGDPLVHMIRNSIDHGMESPEVRRELGKPEQGTIVLEASHSGNNVFIFVRDDGAGIDVEKIRERVIDRGLQTCEFVRELSDAQMLDYIWHPGFSTAERVSDVSGRGVGMDVVRNRITALNGTVEVTSEPGEGTSFALRLPLTLAIMECLLVRLRQTVFSIPIDDVREIVSISRGDVITVHGQASFEVRGEYIPLVRIEEVFHWNGSKSLPSAPSTNPSESNSGNELEVVILHVSGRTLGLRVDELMGNQDIVIKSLSDNFIDVRGLSGASIMGDGKVCLMLDVGALMEMMLRVELKVGEEVRGT